MFYVSIPTKKYTLEASETPLNEHIWMDVGDFGICHPLVPLKIDGLLRYIQDIT